MSCRRVRLRRNLIPYIEGQLAPRPAARLDKHLRRCPECRAELGRLREGHRLAQRLAALPNGKEPAVPTFESLERRGGSGRGGGWFWERWFDVLTMPRVVPVLAALVILLLALLLVTNRSVLTQGRGAAAKPAALDISRFQTVSIADLPANTLPHVATEGYVRDVRIDQEEKTLHFILAQNPAGPGPFVVCEIMGSWGFAIPREGSRVRVYGVARYDGQAGRNWHELNPVLDIAVLKR
jgi:hypothetical protein